MRRKRRRVKLETPEPLEGVLERAGENRFAKRQLPIPLAQWRDAVGPRIADKARPIALERDVLVVKVTTSVWANELSLLSADVVAKLTERGFAVKSLRFRVGPLDVVEGIAQRREYRQVPPPAELGPELVQSLATIEDEELRNAIASAASRVLAYQTPPKKGVSGGPPGAPGPRGAGRGSAPPDRSAAASDEASRRTPAVDSSRRR